MPLITTVTGTRRICAQRDEGLAARPVRRASVMRTLTILATTLAIGCAAPAPTRPFDTDGAPRRDATKDERTDADVAPLDPVVVDDGVRETATSNVWIGHVATVAPVDFGGGVFCSYRVVLSEVEVTLTVDPKGHVTSSRVHCTMTETTTAQCPAAPLGVRQNEFAYDESKDAPAALFAATLTPDPGNLPLASVTVTAEPGDARAMRAQLVFQRFGGTAASLDWTATTVVSLLRR